MPFFCLFVFLPLLSNSAAAKCHFSPPREKSKKIDTGEIGEFTFLGKFEPVLEIRSPAVAGGSAARAAPRPR